MRVHAKCSTKTITKNQYDRLAVFRIKKQFTPEKNIQQRISIFDIGIATLLDDELHRSKSAFKLKQYFNNGVPVLSSDISENNLFLDEEKNGFLCSTPDDFRKRIIEINEMSQDDFMKLSSQARKAIPKFNLTYYCDTLLSEQRETVSNRVEEILETVELRTINLANA